MSQSSPNWVESWVTELFDEIDWTLVASVSTTGEWIVDGRKQCQGKADTMEAGKLAALGAMAGQLRWHREWSAKFAKHELVILELEDCEREDPTRPFLWVFADHWPHSKSGVSRTLEKAKAAALRAAREHERQQATGQPE